jgi:hypothetical protein
MCITPWALVGGVSELVNLRHHITKMKRTTQQLGYQHGKMYLMLEIFQAALCLNGHIFQDIKPSGVYFRLHYILFLVFYLLSFSASLLFIITMASKFTSASFNTLSPHNYIAQKEGQSRSPCPALNALANHGYM